MNKQKNLIPLIVSAIMMIALMAYAAYLLIGIYPDVLITAQDRNVFDGSSLFFTQSLSRPFGLMQYAGAYLTQTFYHPALGTGLLIALWVVTAIAGIKAFRLSGAWCSLMMVPVACLLASVVDLGYWIYCLIIPGYWFSQTLAYALLMLLLWAASATPRRYRLAWYVVIGFAAFPLYGWCSYLFAASLALSQLRKGASASWVDALGLALTGVAPIVFFAMLYQHMPLRDVYAAGFPIFKTFTDEILHPSVPFYIIAVMTMMLSLRGLLTYRSVKEEKADAAKKTMMQGLQKVVVPSLVPVVVCVASAYCVWDCMFKDDNYLYEMQMTQATMADDWQKVISVAEKAERPSRTMVMLKNIALMNTGELGERSYELSNDGAEIYNPDSLNLNIMQIAAPVIYYNYGKMNFAMRWCMEFSVIYGFSPYYLKTLARCAEATGERKLAQRYIDNLHRTMWYGSWQPAPETAVVKELQAVLGDVLENDENSCERYLIGSLCKTRQRSSLLVSEVSLLYATIIRDPNLFWISFYDYTSHMKGKEIPANYLEAYCTFADRCPPGYPAKIDAPEVQENFKAFMAEGDSYAEMGFDEAGVAEAMKSKWGSTYWWFNAFGRQAY